MQPFLGSGTVCLPQSWAVTNSSKAGGQAGLGFPAHIHGCQGSVPCLHPAVPSRGNWTTQTPALNPSCNIAHPWFASLRCGTQPVTGKPQLPQWIPLFHAQRGVRQRCPGKKGPLRPAVCQVPVWAPGTQSERSPCLPGAHSQAREARLSQPFQRFWRKQSPLPGGHQPPSTRHSIGRGHHLPLPRGRGSRPLIYLPSPRPRTEHCNASS